MWALVPAKCFHRAKSRLRLPVETRARLARRFLEHVLVTTAPLVEGIVVITDCPTVASHARRRGALTMIRPPARTLARTIDEGVRAIGGATLVLMADLPKLQRADVANLIALSRRSPMVIAPDGGERGTNALALRAPLSTCFGREDSFAAHLARAEARVYRSRTTGFDVDLPGDLARL